MGLYPHRTIRGHNVPNAVNILSSHVHDAHGASRNNAEKKQVIIVPAGTVIPQDFGHDAKL